MIRSNIEDYLSYDFIGAPWNTKSNKLVAHLYSKKIIKSRVGNGGFSLRSVNASIDIISRIATDHTEAEDVFFSRGMSKLGYNIADDYIANIFCRDRKSVV